MQDKLRKVAYDYTRLYLRENIREKEKKYEATKTQVAEQEERYEELTEQIDEQEQVLADKLEHEEIIDIMIKGKIDEKEKLARMVEEAREYVRLGEEPKRLNEEYWKWKR